MRNAARRLAKTVATLLVKQVRILPGPMPGQSSTFLSDVGDVVVMAEKELT